MVMLLHTARLYMLPSLVCGANPELDDTSCAAARVLHLDMNYVACVVGVAVCVIGTSI